MPEHADARPECRSGKWVVALLCGFCLLFLAALAWQHHVARRRHRAADELIAEMDEMIARMEAGSRAGIAERLAALKERFKSVAAVSQDDRVRVQKRFDRLRDLNRRLYEEREKRIERDYPGGTE